jgi:hypothetical protein
VVRNVFIHLLQLNVDRGDKKNLLWFCSI